MLVLTLFLAQMVTAPSQSRESELLGRRESAAWQLIATLRSPFCPGLTLESCPSWQAESLRADIRRRMADGESANHVRQALVLAFGQPILGEPTWDGFDLTGWLMPSALVGLSAAVLVAALCRRKPVVADPRHPAFVPAVQELPAAERLRLEELLRRELTESEEPQ
jgi:cytochrome c-type biogenesis protein CcmH/NrfF